MSYTDVIQKIPRQFVPTDFVITTWESLEPFYRQLLEREITTKEAMEQWLKDVNELDAVVSEDSCWRYIRTSCDTENKELEAALHYFYLEIQPRIQPIADKLNRKLVESPFVNELDPALYFTYLRGVRKSIELFREENVALGAEISVLQQQFGVINGKMMVEVNGQEYTLQQASKFLENPDRNLREQVYRKMQERRREDKDTLNDLYSQLLAKRHQVALNAGFTNYRDYKFEELGRFDYTKEDCYQFHESVKQHLLPMADMLLEKKRQKLQLDTLRPWDTEAEPAGIAPLTPFDTGEELAAKAIDCFSRLRPYFGECLKAMREMGHLDLESRKGKAPGGYNCPLAESGAPFIFMNAAGQMSDVTTMVHEGGHAIHSFVAHPLKLNAFKEYPMEIAEVASMAMELFSMEYWEVFFDNPEELKRAKEHQLERVITIFPWIATIDKFQHWVYENPTHSLEERTENWMRILQEFGSSITDWSGLEAFRTSAWQRQLHLYEVPFYYIEYGIAQLGALALWKQFKENREKALDNYIKALSLGGTKTLPELYESAEIKFNFTPAYIKELADFVKAEMEKI
jgi:oligoendopeptidase F